MSLTEPLCAAVCIFPANFPILFCLVLRFSLPAYSIGSIGHLEPEHVRAVSTAVGLMAAEPVQAGSAQSCISSGGALRLRRASFGGAVFAAVPQIER